MVLNSIFLLDFQDGILDIDQTITELVEYDTYQLIPFTAQDGSVVIGAGSSDYLLYLPLIGK